MHSRQRKEEGRTPQSPPICVKTPWCWILPKKSADSNPFRISSILFGRASLLIPGIEGRWNNSIVTVPCAAIRPPPFLSRGSSSRTVFVRHLAASAAKTTWTLASEPSRSRYCVIRSGGGGGGGCAIGTGAFFLGEEKTLRRR